jgi:hypothetical protein
MDSHKSDGEDREHGEFLLLRHLDVKEHGDRQKKDQEIRGNVKANDGVGKADRVAGAISRVVPELGKGDTEGHLADESPDVVNDDDNQHDIHAPASVMVGEKSKIQ